MGRPKKSRGLETRAVDGKAKRAKTDWEALGMGTRPACEVLVTYRDGSSRKILRARSWTPWLKNRIVAESPSVMSAELVRHVPRAEYLRLKPAGTIGRPAHWQQAEATAPTLPFAESPDTFEPPVEEKRPGPHAWEVLYRRHGMTSTKIVVGVDEASAVGLISGMEGVDAATSIRPLTVEEYRQSTR